MLPEDSTVTSTDEKCRLRRTGIYSDLVIKCGQLKLNVHRAIVCTRSEYFAAACKPNAFKVSGSCSVARR